MKMAKGVKLYKVHFNFNNEFNAWWLVQQLHSKYMNRHFNKKIGNFVIEFLNTHFATHYTFKDALAMNHLFIKR